MVIIDGKKIAEDILNEIKSEVEKLKFQPIFCDILVGDDPSSVQYVKMKAKTAERVGMKFLNANYPATISTEDLILEVKKLNAVPNLCGLIMQLPLPESISKQEVLDAIDPRIDVDCTGKVNTDLFYKGRAYMRYPTALAVMEALDSLEINFERKKFLVVGYGQLVGKPVNYLLEKRRLMVDVARSKTPDIFDLMKKADVIISAVGKPNLITGDKIKPGVVVIDAGTSEADGGVVGDVQFDSIKDIASFISPVPGGVGPVTVAKLLSNVLKVAKMSK